VTQPAVKQRSWKRIIARLLAFAVVAYLGAFIVLLSLERKFIFFPTTADEHWSPAPTKINAEDVNFTLTSGDTIHAWWCVPDGWKPERGAMLYLHGNAGNLSHRGESIRRFHQKLEIAVLIIDYPGYGKSTGKPDEESCYEAADLAYDWIVKDKQVPAEQVILYGGSLGGGVALELAHRREHRALILVATFTSIPDMAAHRMPWFPSRPFLRTRFDNLDKIGKCNKPIFMAHGTGDRVIPFEHGERLYEAANDPKRFLTLAGFDHNHTPPVDFYDELKRFLADPKGAERIDWTPPPRN